MSNPNRERILKNLSGRAHGVNITVAISHTDKNGSAELKTMQTDGLILVQNEAYGTMRLLSYMLSSKGRGVFAPQF